MKTQTQPQHTQGRNWLRESPNSIWVEIMADETHVATIPYKTKEQQANAQRIVMAVNMHDKFIDSIKTGLTLLQASLDILKKEGGNTTVINHIDCIMDEQKQLLKQIEANKD